jgi:hypothetical protein
MRIYATFILANSSMLLTCENNIYSLYNCVSNHAKNNVITRVQEEMILYTNHIKNSHKVLYTKPVNATIDPSRSSS